jgi:hypothetical protein
MDRRSPAGFVPPHLVSSESGHPYWMSGKQAAHEVPPSRILCSCGRGDSDPDDTFSIVAPVSVRPIPMAPVGSRVISVPIRAIVIAAWVIGRPVKGRKRDRYWQTEMEEDPGLRLGLSQQGDSKDHRQYDNKFFHIVTDEKLDFRLHHAAKGESVLGTVWARDFM